jgi:hypothetical protein
VDTKNSAVEITAETSVTTVIRRPITPVLHDMNVRWVWLPARVLGALSLLAVGAVHLHQYEDLYSAIPTIGTLFLVNFACATVAGVGLLLPLERLWRRFGAWVVASLAVGGIVLAALSYAFLLIAQRRPLFGFMEPGYNPEAIRASQVSEIATVVLLGVFLVVRHVPMSSRGRRPATHPVPIREVHR